MTACKAGVSDGSSSESVNETSMLIAWDAIDFRLTSETCEEVLFKEEQKGYFRSIRQLQCCGKGHALVSRDYLLVDKLYSNFHSLQVAHQNGRLLQHEID